MVEKVMQIVKKDKKILVLVGILVLCIGIIAFPMPKQKNVEAKPDKTIERQLCDVLKQVNGVGKVSVLITYDDEGTKVLASELKVKTAKEENESEEKPILTGGTPMVVRTISPKIKGVIVVAQGANNVTVKENLKQAVISVTGVMSHRVSILEMKK